MRKKLVAAALYVLGIPLAMADEFPLAVEPWLSEETLVDDISLAGDWTVFGMCVDFVPGGERKHVYNVSLSDCDGGEGEAFTISMHRVDERLLLLIGPRTDQEFALLMPVYWLLKAELDGETMKLFSIDKKSFEWRADSAGIELKNGLILSSTEDLTAFLRWQVIDYLFFEAEPEYTLTRVQEDD